MSLDNFFRSGFDFAKDEYELKLQYLLYNSVLSIVAVMLFILSILRFLQENYIQAVLDFTFIFISIYAIFYIKRSRNHIKKAVPILIFIFFILISLSFINTNMYFVGGSWFLVLLVPAYYLGGLKAGYLATLASTVAIIILGQVREDSYKVVEYFYVLSPLLMSSVFIYLYEKRVNIAKELLIVKNITLEKEIEVKSEEEEILLQHNKELAAIISESNIELYIVDFNTNKYLYVNQGASKALGYSLEELKDMSVYDVNPTLTKESVDKLKKIGETSKNIMNITKHQKKDGSSYGVQSLIHLIEYHGKKAYVIYDINLTDLDIAQAQLLKEKEELLKQAHYDTLTKLPNRILFSDRLQQATVKSNRYKKDFAILFIDLDKFKEINDTLGHNTGDLVLCEIASRFKSSLREEDTISRFGGDEFVCIIEQLESAQTISSLAQKLINRVKEPILIKDNILQLTCSIGISIYPKDTTDEKTLLHHADSAMYKAKDMGKDNYQFYSKC